MRCCEILLARLLAKLKFLVLYTAWPAVENMFMAGIKMVIAMLIAITISSSDIPDFFTGAAPCLRHLLVFATAPGFCLDTLPDIG
ncbi:MAG: hypothetical protein ACD_39C00805G0001 [uncultured bacterium]|nr:MAG: hypothetical protein ACD_39C00805G0001 [uncultured bacterium]